MHHTEKPTQEGAWRGQGMAEYGILLLLMGVASIGIVTVLGLAFSNQFSNVVFCADRSQSQGTGQCGGGYELSYEDANGTGDVDGYYSGVGPGAGATVPEAGFTVSCVYSTCTFDATLSTQADSPIIGYDWSFGDTNTASGLVVEHTFIGIGDYDVVLTVTDMEGDSDNAVQVVTATTAAPVAAFTFSCSGLTCNFNGAGSSDDVMISSWAWNFGDGVGTSVGTATSYTYPAAGTYSVSLTVTDNDGLTNTLSQGVDPAEPNDPPAADFTITCTDLDCTFDASASSDPDGDALVTYKWSYGDFNQETLNVETTAHTYSMPATYNVTLVVTDERGASGIKTKAVTATTPNDLPTANISIVCTGLSCVFDGSGSSDPDGIVETWAWVFGTGDNDSGESVNYTYLSPGIYDIILTVVDNFGGTDTAYTTLTVEELNNPPTANFSMNCSGLTCSFDGRSSSDPDTGDSIASYTWDFDGTGTSALAIPSHTFPSDGDYSVTLTVADQDGATHSITQTVTVAALNQRPTADFTATCVELVCDFDASASVDPDGTIVTYEWDFGDTTSDSVVTAMTNHEFPAVNSYFVTMTVTDNNGATASLTKRVTVTAPNLSPVASFTYSCDDLACTFTNSSTDPDGTVESWSWNFGDSSTSTSQSPSHTFGTDNYFDVTLTVTDNNGATDTNTVTIPVERNIMWLTDLSGISELATGSSGNWRAVISVEVHGPLGPIEGAKVAGDFGTGQTTRGSCITDASGQCTIYSPWYDSKDKNIQFAVEAIDMDDTSGRIYDSGENLVSKDNIKVDAP